MLEEVVSQSSLGGGGTGRDEEEGRLSGHETWIDTDQSTK